MAFFLFHNFKFYNFKESIKSKGSICLGYTITTPSYLKFLQHSRKSFKALNKHFENPLAVALMWYEQCFHFLSNLLRFIPKHQSYDVIIQPQSGANPEVIQHVYAPSSNLQQHVQAPISNVQQHVQAPPSNLQQHVQAPTSNLQQPFRGSPLRKEAPLTASAQKPAATYVSQPVATSFQGYILFWI